VISLALCEAWFYLSFLCVAAALREASLLGRSMPKVSFQKSSPDGQRLGKQFINSKSYAAKERLVRISFVVEFTRERKLDGLAGQWALEGMAQIVSAQNVTGTEYFPHARFARDAELAERFLRQTKSLFSVFSVGSV
jgi:hypothetical protein